MSGCEFVVFRSGLAVPLAAVRLALELEGRGLRLRVEGEDLLIGPRELITDADRAAIKRWKPHLRAILCAADDTHERTP